jgi:glycosyltransferase involved in cell wall biosynthesis
MGSDPWDASSFSGSSKALFEALDAEGVLVRAFGLDISRAEFMVRAAPRYHPQKEVWRRRVFQSRGYRDALTADLRRKIRDEDKGSVILQVGAYADGPSAYAGLAPVVTYQDSLAAEYWTSPFVPAALRDDARLKREHWDFEIAVAKGAARVLTQSEHTRRSYIANYGLAPDKVENVRIGFNATPPSNLPPKDYSRPEILFIGKEYERKGGDLLAPALARLRARFPEATLHVVGPPTRPSSLPDAPGIVFHGFLSRGDAAQKETFYGLLARAALIVLPSRYEPTGLATLEAMSWGAPAIVTNDWAFPENVVHGETGWLLPALTADALGDAMLGALSDPERLARMSAAAFAAVPERFSWKGVAQRIIAACERVAAAKAD